MKPTINFHTIPLIIYPFDIMFYFGHNYAELHKEVWERLPEESRGDVDKFYFTPDFKARTVFFDTGQTIIWIKELTHGNISHEIFHAVDFIMGRLRMRLTQSNYEAWAYLIGYVTDEVYKVLKIR